MDPLKNFVYGHVTVAPSPANSGTTLSVSNTDADNFLDPSTDGEYNLVVWPANQLPLATNAEIIRVTAKGAADSGGSGNTQLTIEREAEDSNPRSIQVGDQISQNITKNMLDERATPFLTVGFEGANFIVDGTDDDVQIQEAIDATSLVGGGAIYIKEGTYDITTTIQIPSNITLYGDGWSTILRLGDEARDEIIANSDQSGGNSNIVISDIQLDGNKANQTAGVSLEGIDFVAVDNFLIKNVLIKDVGTVDVANTAIGFSFAAGCNEGRIISCKALGNNHYGFNSYNASHLLFVNNVSEANGRHGFGSSNGSSFNTWSGNTAKDNPDMGFWIRNTSSSSIVGNTILMPTGSDYGIQIKGNSTEDANQVSDQRNIISGNTIKGDCTYGIYLQNHANYNVIIGNSISDVGTNGIYVIANEWNTISNNSIIDSGETGINVSGGTSLTISGNYIKGSGRDGILVNVWDSIISGNTCADNSLSSAGTYNGISISGRGRNVVVGNRCYDSQGTKTQGYGIAETTASDYNTYSGNNLLNNLTGELSASGANNRYTYESGGTDVAVTDGGTGASTASGARTNLGVQAKSFLTVGAADADYITDGTADEVQINSAIASLTDGGIVLIKPGTYNLAGAVTMGTNNVILQGSGRDTILLRSSDFNANMMNVTATDVTVKDLKVDGNSATWTSDHHGVVITGDRVIIRDIFITDITHHGMNTPGANNVLMEGCYVQNTGTLGSGADGVGIIAGDAATDIKIVNCTVFNAGYHGMQVYTGTSKVFISNCHISQSGVVTATGDSIKINPDCSDIHISNCYLGNGGASANGITTVPDTDAPITGLLIENCTIELHDLIGIRLDGAQDVIIRGCNIRNNGITGSPSVDYGIRINAGTGFAAERISIIGNNIYDNQDTPTQARPIGIFDATSIKIIITGNNMYGHVSSNAVQLNTGVLETSIQRGLNFEG